MSQRDISSTIQRGDLIPSPLPLLNQRGEAFGSRHPITLFYQIGNHLPIEVVIEINTNPTVVTNVGRHKEPLRLGAHKHCLCARRGLAPQRHTLVRAMSHGEDLISHLKRRIPYASCLDGFWEGQTD